jgi:hypothetical protein
LQPVLESGPQTLPLLLDWPWQASPQKRTRYGRICHLLFEPLPLLAVLIQVLCHQLCHWQK